MCNPRVSCILSCSACSEGAADGEKNVGSIAATRAVGDGVFWCECFAKREWLEEEINHPRTEMDANICGSLYRLGGKNQTRGRVNVRT